MPNRLQRCLQRRPVDLAAATVLGFSTSGLFDGILLHQILQWHHLLSGVRKPWLIDLRAQVLADGLFHFVMWCLLAVGLWLSFRARVGRVFSPTRRVFAWGLIGFGAWHFVDAIIDRWAIGIHHIRDDASSPLTWDIVWLVGFGVAPVLVGLWMRHGGDGSAPSVAGAPEGRAWSRILSRTRKYSLAPWVGLACACAIVSGTASTTDEALLVTMPGVSPAQALDKIASLDGRVRWADRSGAVWSLRMPSTRATAPSLEKTIDGWRDGVIVFRGTLLVGGCSL
jgi:uncharacterized membrane protein